MISRVPACSLALLSFKYGPYRYYFETCAEEPAKGIMIGLYSLSKIRQSFREAVRVN